ncbi:MAG: acetyl-CoA hydrolase/transferase family protein [Chloroflexi bacterium]|nr:acetyl-CoA hydrolase/transferase family protein [Chloroflexota bacterium]
MDERWREEYQRKLTSPDEAVTLIPDGSSIVQPLIAGEPPAVLAAIAARARSGGFTSLTMRALLPFSATKATVLDPDLKDVIRWDSLFVGGADRAAVAEGRAGFTPNFFHQVPRLLSEFIPVDVCIATVSPMDRHGYMSLGVAVDYTSTAARVANVLILEVNSHMPRTHGRSFIHISEATAVVENDNPLPELPTPAMRDEDEAIGKAIAEMVPNGATIQLGIGGVPNAVAQYLRDHEDLGIHSEMFTDSMVDLIEDGVANGVRKTLHPRKAVFTFAAGSERLYRFLDDNPYCEAHPVSYTNSPDVIAQNNELISVNAAIEIDLSGQCCAESIGPAQFSGTGGQADFVRGAFNSPDGKSFLALYSTAKGGEVSRIVPMLTLGAVVTTARQDVHYVVSEYGVAMLKGKSVSERARSLIGLAHPKFRDELTAAAKKLGYL